jgi:hypothetical protein
MVESEEFRYMMHCLTKGIADVDQQQDAEYMIQFLLNKVKDQGDYMAEFMVSRYDYEHVTKGVL